MFLLQPVLDLVHFLRTTIFYTWSISLHLGRGTFLLLKNIVNILQDLCTGLIILGEELFRFFTELNSSIDAAATYIGSSANSGISVVIDAIIVFVQSFSSFFTSSELRTRLLATKLGLAVKNLCILLYGALLLIADSTWWLLTLIPRTIIKLIVDAADFSIFSFNAASKAILYAAQTLINDIFRITISLFVIFLIWKKRRHIRLLLVRCFVKVKMFLSTHMQVVLMRWRNFNRPRFGNLARPQMRRSPLSQLSRSALNEFKFSHQQICVICRDAPKSVLLWPCRHLCLCEECADRIEGSQQTNTTCPLCRGQVESFVSIYT